MRPHASRAVLALVLANLLPLAGVLWLGWRLFDVMLLYWLENAVIGAYTLLRMATAGEQRFTTLLFGPFFVLHYGAFWSVHGLFVVSLFGGAGVDFTPFADAVSEPATAPGGGWSGPEVLVALAGLAVSHGVSFVQNWWRGGERRGATPAAVMTRPYGRVVVLHLTILFGGVAVMALGQPIAALALMVLLKIGVDAIAHLREHRALARPPEAIGEAPA